MSTTIVAMSSDDQSDSSDSNVTGARYGVNRTESTSSDPTETAIVDQDPSSRNIDDQGRVIDDDGNVIESIPLDRRPGNSVTDDTDEFNDRMAFKPNDGRSITRTTFYVSENSDLDVEKWRRIQKLNDGVHDKDRKSRNEWADRKRWVMLVGDHFNLGGTLTKRIHQVSQRISYNPYAGAGYNTESTILALATMLHDRHSDLDSIDQWLLNRDEMAVLLDSFDLTRSDIWSLISMLKEHCYLFNDDLEPRTPITKKLRTPSADTDSEPDIDWTEYRDRNETTDTGDSNGE